MHYSESGLSHTKSEGSHGRVQLIRVHSPNRIQDTSKEHIFLAIPPKRKYSSSLRMNRRDFARTVVGAALGGSVARSVPARVSAETVAALHLSVMGWTVYQDLPFEQRLEKISTAGYTGIELNYEFGKWSDEDYRKANSKKRSLGMRFDAVSGVPKGFADPSGRDAFLQALKQFSLPIAAKLESSIVIVHSGHRIEGASGQVQYNASVEALKAAADLAAKENATLAIESIDPEEDPKGYLTSVVEAFHIAREVNSPHVKVLYDFYHEQIAAGNLLSKLENNIELVALVHIADVPGRHQPGTGEINYGNIYRKLADLKYDGYVAMEFLPAGDPDTVLKAAREQVSQALSVR